MNEQHLYHRCQRYTSDEEEYILEHYGRLTIATIARNLARPRAAVGQKCRKLCGIRVRPGKITDEQLRQYHEQGMNAVQIANVVGCSPSAVRLRRLKLGIDARHLARRKHDS